MYRVITPGALLMALVACDRDPIGPGPGAHVPAAIAPLAPAAALGNVTTSISTFRPLTIPPGYTAAYTQDVNDNDVLVGYLYPAPSTGGGFAPALWRAGNSLTLLPLPAGAIGGSARAINSADVVVGTTGDRALRWRPGAAAPDVLPSPPQSSGDLANAINDGGDAVGRVGPNGTERAAFWDHAATPMLTLLQTGASTVTSAHAINNAGVIAGYRMGPVGMLPVRWTSATAAPQDLPLPNDYRSGEVEDIAEDGTMVGMIEGTVGGRLTVDAAVWSLGTGQVDVTVLPKLQASQNCFATAISSGSSTSRWIVGNCGGSSVLWARDTVYAIGMSGGFNGYSYGISTSGLMPILPSSSATPMWALQLTADPWLVTDPGGPYTANEGATVTFDGSASSGSPAGTPLTYAWIFYGTTDVGSGPTPSYTYRDNGIYWVGLRVSDGSGLPGALVESPITINNVAPSVSAGPDVSLDVGQSFALGAIFTDPGIADGPWSYRIDWGDATNAVFGSRSAQGAITGAKTYGKPGTYTVTLLVQDKDGAFTTDTVVVTVRGGVPTAAPGGPYAGMEGAPITFDGRASADPDGGALTYSWSFGDGGTASVAAPQHVYADDGAYALTLTVGDAEGLSHTSPATAVIANVPPRITTIGIPSAPVPLGSPVVVTTAFVGAAVDQFGGIVTWDDGGTSPLSGLTSGFTATHTYATPGVYTVNIRVTDDDGSFDEQTATGYIVVYDPTSSSFVAGAGTIASPAGAMPADPTATGQAAFGFQSRYVRGAQVPTGFTRFEFRAGNLDFEATQFEWLVIAGTKAQVKGIGTIAGRVGTFKFMVTALDGEAPGADRVRVKITDATGAVVYDNQQGASDGAEPATAITSGSITVRS